MKKLIIISLLGIFVSSCGSKHTCDAYRSADYTKQDTTKRI
mgnify:CR=1 FL=1